MNTTHPDPDSASHTAAPLSPTTRSRLARLRRSYQAAGMEALSDRIARLSPSSARAALVLAIATEDWTRTEKAALDPRHPHTEDTAA